MLLSQTTTITPEDEQLQLAKTLWVEGDWESLSALADEVDHSVNNDQLVAYFAAAFSQLGMFGKAKEYWQQTKQSEAGDKLQHYRLLLSGVHNSLARARAVNGELKKSQRHWDKSVAVVTYGPQQRLTKQLRSRCQLKQLGLPERWAEIQFEKNDKKYNLPHEFLYELYKEYPNDPAVVIGLAESAQRQGLFDDAIRYWQALASLIQESMPQAYYDRLDEAYQNQKSFPLASPEEEQLKGKGDKHELLKYLHKTFQPSLYLEIGVQTGKSLLLAECKAIGIDPMPRPNIKVKDNQSLLRMTSDEFFEHHADNCLNKSPDLVFIDGMHLFEYALRDFINVERYAGPKTIVIVDDIFPGHPAQAERERRTRAWTGDVWKLVTILEEYRPDLNLAKLDVFPTGLLIISNLDSTSKVLRDNYVQIVKSLLAKKIESKVVDRSDAASIDSFFQNEIL